MIEQRFLLTLPSSEGTDELFELSLEAAKALYAELAEVFGPPVEAGINPGVLAAVLAGAFTEGSVEFSEPESEASEYGFNGVGLAPAAIAQRMEQEAAAAQAFGPNQPQAGPGSGIGSGALRP